MPETDRLDGDTEWIDLSFVERERTPKPIIEVGIRLHLAGLSLLNTKRELEKLGVSRSRTAIHDWVQKTELEPATRTQPSRVAVDETVVQVNADRYWLYAAVDPTTNEFLHARLFHAQTTERSLLFFRELAAKYSIEDTTFLVDAARYLRAALDRLGFDYRVEPHGDRTHVERVFREVKRRTSSFANTFSHAHPRTAETWLQAFAVWWNQCQS